MKFRGGINGSDNGRLRSVNKNNDDRNNVSNHRKTTSDELLFSISRPSSSRLKAPHVSTFLGKAGSVGLDTLGTSITNFNSHTPFVSNMPSTGNKLRIARLSSQSYSC